MLKLCRITKLKVFFPVLVYVFNFDLFEFSAAILEKGLLCLYRCTISKRLFVCLISKTKRISVTVKRAQAFLLRVNE